MITLSLKMLRLSVSGKQPHGCLFPKSSRLRKVTVRMEILFFLSMENEVVIRACAHGIAVFKFKNLNW